jgi:hypothetical protein
MMRTVALVAPASGLLGNTDEEDAKVDGWLAFIWSSIDLPLQVLAGGANPAIQTDLDAALAKLEAHLTGQTYMVGSAITLADISLAASLKSAGDAGKPKEESNLSRWFQSITTQPFFAGKPPAAAAPSGSGVMLNGVAPPVENVLYRRHRVRIKEVLADEAGIMGQTVTVAGWTRTTRNANKGQLLFVELNDGSTGLSLQCVLDSEKTEGFDECKNCGGTGSSFQFVGQIIPSQGDGQALEIAVTHGKLLGAVYGGDAEGKTIGGKLYPMSKKEHTLEYMREHAHLRARGRIHASAMRIRHAMAFATHNFFHNHGFLYVHTPIITGADCEGAGEQFGVTTLMGKDHQEPNIQLPVHEPPPVRVVSRLVYSFELSNLFFSD